ncbi:hypothetical protein C2S52_022158 [Perilla frutescens var. hirtella]|nr:hypothetical protein C2S52_022158 [Perilla frutescens var. hirtella]KAH6807443.1 hypothetical protein C2S51_028551 [Perilla frutescens var. frutescens]
MQCGSSKNKNKRRLDAHSRERIWAARSSSPRLPGDVVRLAPSDRVPLRPRLPRRRTRFERLRRLRRTPQPFLLHLVPHRRRSHWPPRSLRRPTGDKDIGFESGGTREYLESTTFHKLVPDHEIVILDSSKYEYTMHASYMKREILVKVLVTNTQLIE